MINMDLFSELRTIYETTLLDPHTYRITIKMKDIIDGKLLREAVDMTMERYPYFRVCLYIKGDAIGFEENPAEVPVIHTKKRISLGGEQSSGHLIAFCYWKNRLFIDAYHGLSDGGGIYPLIRTLLFYYCSSFYGKELSAEGVRLRGSVITKEELEDPARDFICGKNSLGIKKWNKPAFQLTDSGIVRIKPDSIVYNVRISEEEFMRMAERSRCITATVSYTGKANFGEVERYIQEFEALPSTALPSTHVPLTIEMSALHGYFFINFIQYFDEYDYFSTFLDQLRQNDIDYDVLNVVEARYPRVELPQWNL